MILFKLGLLTCAFYVGLTILLEAGLWVVASFWGFGVLVSGRHPGFNLGVKFGVIFGAIWLISFSAAWWIVYLDFKSRLLIRPN
jgi:hypothetical protein